MSICADKLKEMFPDYDQKKIDRLMGEISRMQDNGSSLEDSLSKVNQQIKERIENLKLNASKYKLERSQNLQKNLDFLKFANQDAFKNDPVAALEAYVGGGSNKLSKGGNLGLQDIAATSVDQILRPFHSQMTAKGLVERVKSGDLDLGISVALDNMKEGGNLNDPRISPSAMEAAQLFRAVNDKRRLLYENAGYPTGFIEGYKGPQTHDPLKIKEDKAGWIQSQLKNLDHDKVFGADATQGQKLKKLNEDWQKITNRVWTKDQVGPDAADSFQSVSERGLGTKTYAERSYHYKDGEAFHDYNSQFGKGNLYETLLPAIDRDARNAAQLSKFGTNPLDTFSSHIERMKRFYESDAGIEKAGGAEQASKVVKDIMGNRASLLDKYKMAAGISDGAGELLPAKVASAAKNLNNVSLLGSVMFKKPSELAFASGLINATTGDGFLRSTSLMVKDFLGLGLPGSSSETSALRQLGVRYIDDYNASQFTDRYGSGYNEPGMLSKSADLAYKFFGINAHTNRGRIAIAGALSRIMETHAGSSFDTLPSRVSANLQRYNIGVPEWEMMRQSVGTFEHDGSKAMLPENVMKIDDASAQKIIDANGLKYKSPEAFKFDVQNKYTNMLSDHAENSVLHSNLATQSAMRGGVDRNSVKGMLWTMAMQYKSIAYMMTENMARMTLSNPDKFAQSLGEAFKHPLAGGDVMNNLVPTMVFGTALYGASKFLKEEGTHQAGNLVGLSTKEPITKAQDDPGKTILDAFIGGGGGGLMADTLGQGSMEKAVRTIAGPTLSRAADLADVGWKVATPGRDPYGRPREDRDFVGAGKKASDLAESFIPGQSLPLMKPVLDNLIFDHIKNAIQPDYLEKKQIREAREAR
jgi:hypothetical protein